MSSFLHNLLDPEQLFLLFRFAVFPALAVWVAGCTGAPAPEAVSATPQLFAGGFQLCAVTGTSLECQMIDQLVLSDRSDTMAAPAMDVSSVGVGYSHGCAVAANDGHIECWGDSMSGALAAPAGAFREVASGGHFSCAADTAGAVTCWGEAAFGQTTPPNEALHDLVAMNEAACGLRADETPVCWGRVREEWFTPPPSVPLDRVKAGGGTACGLDAAGGILCWGRGNWGLLDDVPDGASWAAVEVGGKHVCALSAYGEPRCWGSTAASAIPEGTFTALATGYYYTCGRDAAGMVSCAGCSAGDDGWCRWQ
jgi:hypothetical protein